MSKNQKSKMLLVKQLDAMSEALSKGEDIKATRVLQDYELDIVSGGTYDKSSCLLFLE